MRAGQLRHRIDLIRLVDQGVSSGGVRQYEQVIAERPWANVEAIYGNESVADAGVKTETNYKITIRWRPSIDSTYLVRYGGVLLDVSAVVDPDGRRRELQLYCHKHVGR